MSTRRQDRIACSTSFHNRVFAFVCSACLQKTTVLVRVLNFLLRLNIQYADRYRTSTLSPRHELSDCSMRDSSTNQSDKLRADPSSFSYANTLTYVGRHSQLLRCLFEDGNHKPFSAYNWYSGNKNTGFLLQPFRKNSFRFSFLAENSTKKGNIIILH